MFVLKRKDFLSVLERVPEAAEMADILERKWQDNNFEPLGVKCYLCKERGHVAIHWQKLVVYNDREK
jgi:hypothetical protein